MEIVYARCAGLDVHARQVVACARLVSEDGAVRYHHVRMPTTTPGLLTLVDWLQARGVTHVVMEATGVYWKPVWHVLEGQMALRLANAQHVRTLRGHKSDQRDAKWLADLLAVGLIRGSFVPPAPIQALRDLTRTRKQFTREIHRHRQRLHKILEDANLKLGAVVTDLLGQSGRAVMRGLIAGETDPHRLAALTHGLKASPGQLVDALTGWVTPHHRLMLTLHLRHIEETEATLATLERELEDALAPFRAVRDRLLAVPGISTTVAAVILAEIGPDLRAFPSAGHLVSWAGLAPRLDESAGKRRSTRTRPSAPWLKTTLVQAAWAAARTHDTYFHAQFLRLKSRRGPKKAVVAVAASLLTAVYYMLRDDTAYQELGGRYFAERDKTRLANHLVRRLRALGLTVEIRDAA